MNSSQRELLLAPLFTLFNHQDIEYFSSRMQMKNIEPGGLMFDDHDGKEHFYIIAAGQVEVTQAAGLAEEQLLGVWGEGELIGEFLFINHEGKLTARARAINHVQVYEMTRTDFDTLLTRQPGLAYDMVKNLSRRISGFQNKAINDLLDKNEQMKQAYEALKAANLQMIEKETMEHELDLAHNIQVSILPHKFPKLEGYDFGAMVVPMRAIGGDFYDFIPLSENRLGIAIGDVSGHGIPAALFMALTVTLLRAEACRTCSPAEVLLRVNRQLTGYNDEGMFVTTLYGVLELKTGEFNFVRAGHVLPILYSTRGRLIEVQMEPGQPLGIFSSPVLSEQVIDLKKGGTLLLYTDGVTEAVNQGNEMFGQPGLEKAIQDNHPLTAQQICQSIFDRVTAHRGEAAQSDDVTLLCIQAQ